MPVYNAAAYVGEAVASMLAQTFADFELIAINDGSKDASRDVLAGFSDPRLRILDQANCGLVETLNRGIHAARGALIARMDSDDVSLPARLEVQVEFLKRHPEVALAGGLVATIDEAGRTLADRVPFPLTHEEIWDSIGRRPWVMCHPAVVFRRDAALAVGLYDPAYKHAEDTEFFARLMSRHRAVNLPEVVLKYRLRRDAVCTAFKEHGRVNAELVAQVIQRWKPGEPFAATAQERAEADARIARSGRDVSPGEARATYYCRIGRELLRGRQWGSAIASYARAAWSRPLRVEAYKGVVAGCLRLGGGRSIASA